jgi:hypothetical protein
MIKIIAVGIFIWLDVEGRMALFITETFTSAELALVMELFNSYLFAHIHQ